MFTLRNVSGNEVEVRFAFSEPKFVLPGETVEVTEKFDSETDDAYLTVKTVKALKGKADDGTFLWEDEDVLSAWPKASWKKVDANKSEEK